MFSADPLGEKEEFCEMKAEPKKPTETEEVSCKNCSHVHN